MELSSAALSAEALATPAGQLLAVAEATPSRIAPGKLPATKDLDGMMGEVGSDPPAASPVKMVQLLTAEL